MGFMDFLGKPKRQVSSRTSVLLTDAGKRAAENQMYTGKTFAILAVLQDHHMSRTVTDIANETDIDVSEVKERVKSLAQRGLVRLMAEHETE